MPGERGLCAADGRAAGGQAWESLMAFSKPDLAVFTPQRILLIVGLTALLLVPTGAFIVNQGAFDAFGPEDEIILQPYDGPNGQYAEINSNDELVVNVTGAGVNPNAVTEIERIFVIGNTGGDQKEVWITHDHQDVLTFYDDETGEPIGEDNNVTLGANESVIVSLRVDTRGDVQVGTTLEATLIIHARIFNTPEVELSDALAFGKVTNGTTATREVTITNNGTAPLAVEDVSINGDDADQFAIESGGDVTKIAPGDSSTVEISFAPTSPGIKNATFDVSTNDTETPTVTMDLSGQSVEPGLEVVGGSAVNFGELRTGQRETKTIRIRNNGPTSVEITDRTLSGVGAPYTVGGADLPVELAPDETYEVTIEFAPSTTGWKNATLDLAAPDAEDGGVTIDITGVGVESALNIEPVPIAFDPIGKDKTAYKTVTISNRGSADLNIESLVLKGVDAGQFGLDTSETSNTIPPGENTTANISFTPTRAENLSAKLEITSDDADTPTKRIAVKGRGLAAKINTSPDSLNYGNVTPGTTKMLNITVENLATSPTDLDVKSARILDSGQKPEAFSIVGGDPPYTLAPGESRDIEIAFTPDEDIEKDDPLRTAQLRILSDGEPSQIDVWLSNEGWRILVRDVPPRSDGVDGEQEKEERTQTGAIESLDPEKVAKDTKRVEMDVNDLPRSMTLDVNVSTASTRQAAAGSDAVKFTTTKKGSFDTNFLHNKKPPSEDAVSYTPPTDREITQYIQLTHSITDEEIKNASFKYRVRKTALPDGTAPSEVVFRRYEGGEWVKYDTTLLRESKTHYMYRVELPGLSEFVLTAPNETEATPTPTPSGGSGGGPPGGAPTTPQAPQTPSAPSTPTPIERSTPGVPLTATPGGAQPTPVTTPQTSPATPQPTPTTPIIDPSVEEVTVEEGNTTITFPGLTDTDTSGGQSLQDVISVEEIDVPPPGQQGRDGPRAEIRTRSDLEGDNVEAAIAGGSGVELQLAREDRAIRRIEAKGADTMTLVGRPIPLTGSHSLFSSKESIEDNWRMVQQVNITVPPEFEDRSAIIRIRVPRERFGNTSPENATIARNNDGWQLLDTTVAERTEDAVILQAQTPGFSRFAVFADNSVSYSWTVETFDRKFTGVTIDPSFDDPGIYNATLTVTDSFGLTDTAQYKILVNDIPRVSIEALGPVAKNETVVLEATAEDEFGNVSYNWTLPNGTTVNGTNQIRYTFQQGEQTVRVVAVDEFGARGSTEATYSVGTQPALTVNFLSRNFRVGWPVVVLGLLVVPLVFLLRMGLLRLDHPPVIEVFERPRIDLEDNDVIIPRLRVSDSGEDLDRIAVRLLDYDGAELAQESGSIGGEAAYEGENVWIRAKADLPLAAGTRYVIEIWVTDAAENETLRARSIVVADGFLTDDDGFDNNDDGSPRGDATLDERILEPAEADDNSDDADEGGDTEGTADDGSSAVAGAASLDDGDAATVDPETDDGQLATSDAPGAVAGEPTFEVFETPWIDLGDQVAVVPHLRVRDDRGDLTFVIATLLDYDDNTIGRRTERPDHGNEYEARDLGVGAPGDTPLEPGETYVVRVEAIDGEGNRTIRSQTVDAPNGVRGGQGGDGPSTTSGASPEPDGSSPMEAVVQEDGNGFVYPHEGGNGSEFVYPYDGDVVPVGRDDRRQDNQRVAALLAETEGFDGDLADRLARALGVGIDAADSRPDHGEGRTLAAGVLESADTDEEYLAALSNLGVDSLDAVEGNALTFFLPPDLDVATVDAILANREQALAYVDWDAPGKLAGQADALARGLAEIDRVADPEGIADAVATNARKWEARL